MLAGRSIIPSYSYDDFVTQSIVRHPVLSPRQHMDDALKKYLVPALRERGFKGSHPHFRRLLKDRIDLSTVQFDKNGGGFVVEISRCEVEGVTTHWGKHVPAKKSRHGICIQIIAFA